LLTSLHLRSLRRRGASCCGLSTRPMANSLASSLEAQSQVYTSYAAAG